MKNKRYKITYMDGKEETIEAIDLEIRSIFSKFYIESRREPDLRINNSLIKTIEVVRK